jgi:acetyl esterase/lipase
MPVYRHKSAEKALPCPASARALALPALPACLPAYLPVGDLDLLIGEDIEYAPRLQQADVLAGLHVYPGGSHAFDLLVPEGG